MIALTAHRRSTSLTSELRSGEFLTAVTGQFAALALDYLETCVFVLDADSRIHFANAAAKRLFENGRLSTRNGLLSSPDGAEITALRRIVKQCVEASASGPAAMTFHRLGDGEDALCLALVAVRQAAGRSADKPLVMLFATTPCEASLPDTRQLRSQFGLTDAQARLAIEIARGEGLKACAQRLGIAMSTGRSHLKQIFEKTETRRQAELVRLISACRFNVPEAAGAEHHDPEKWAPVFRKHQARRPLAGERRC
jgi:DNA-binding CsgD family transcriptional regulator